MESYSGFFCFIQTYVAHEEEQITSTKPSNILWFIAGSDKNMRCLQVIKNGIYVVLHFVESAFIWIYNRIDFLYMFNENWT